MYFRKFVINSPSKRAGSFIWTNLNPLHPRMFCAKFSWNWLSGSGEEDILISSTYFRSFVIISAWKRAGPIIWTHLNIFHPRMLYAEFGWNWPRGSWEDENVRSLQTDGQTDNRRSEKLNFAFSSVELITICAKFSWNWPSGSWEEDKNVRSLQTDGQTDRRTDDGQQLTWAFSSGELKIKKTM